MTFRPLDIPKLSGGKSTQVAVTMSTNSGTGRVRKLNRIVFRTQHLKACCFLRTDELVKVEIGDGEDSGKIRISPNGNFRVSYAGGGKTEPARERALSIVLPPLPGQKPQASSATPVRFTEAEWEIIIDLPSWAIGDAAAAGTEPPEQNSTSPFPPGKPYRISAPSSAAVLKERGVVGA